MKIISSLRDLEPFGIVLLTGEACGLQYRILCDVTTAGKRVVEKCLGLPDTKFANPWNAGTAEVPYVGSVMLAPEMLIPLAVFACLENGCAEAYRMDDFVVGIEPGDAPDAAVNVELTYRVKRVRRFSYRGTAGDRNVHQMTGRVE
jgi:hypothetical protein